MNSADESIDLSAGSARNQRIDRFASGILLAIAVFCLLHGALRGDVTSSEAELLESVHRAQPGFVATNDVSGYARVLTWTRQWTAVTAQGLRCISTVGLLALVGLLFFWLDRDIGRPAGGLAALAFAFSAPAFLLSGRATADVIVAGALMLGIRLVLAPARSGQRAARTGDAESGKQTASGLRSKSTRLLGAAFVGAAVYLAIGAEGANSETGVSLAIAQVSTLALAFPSILAIGLLFGHGFPNECTGPERSALRIAGSWAIWGVAIALLAPKLRLGGALMVVAGGAVLLALAWRRSTVFNRSASVSGRTASLPGRLALGLPAAALVAAMARIACDFHFMERVQAIAVVALFSIPIAAWLARGERREWLWLPIAALAIVCRVVYVNAYLPERDHWHSRKAYAHAIAHELPPETTLYTDLASDAAFRHYLGVPVVPIGRSEPKPTEPGPHYALVTADASSDQRCLDPGRWRLVRSYIGPAGQPWILVRSASRSTPGLATDGVRFDTR